MRKVLVFFFALFSFGYANLLYSQCEILGDQISSRGVPSTAPLNSEVHYVKVYGNIIRETSGLGGVTTDQFYQVFKGMQEIYAPFNIYFDLACLREIKESDWIDNAGECFTVSHSGGITMNMFGAEMTSDVPGKASGVPGYVFYSQYTTDLQYAIISACHEMGHCLGLSHTHQGTIPGCAVGGELPDGSNGTTAGDKVADTPADPGVESMLVDFDYCTSTPTTISPCGLTYDPLIDNIMSYYLLCRNTFTTGQIARIKDHLNTVLASVDRPKFIATAGSNISLTTNEYVDVSLLVQTTGKFTLESNLEFAPGKGVIVEENAEFYADGAELAVGAQDAGCEDLVNSDLWKGIGLHQSVGVNSLPGRLKIYDSNISDAIAGIYQIRKYGNPIIPGLIIGSDNTFTNNQTAIEYRLPTAYSKYQYSIDLRLTDCDFIINDSYLGTKFQNHLDIANVHSSVSFRGCQFYNLLTTSLGEETRGADIFESNVVFVNSGSRLTYFEGFTTGIRESGGGLLHGMFVNGATFDDNEIGVKTLGSRNSTIKSCEFVVESPNTTLNVGCFIQNASGHTITDNTFFNPSSYTAYNFGISFLNVSSNFYSNNSFLGGNVFSGLTRGIELRGTHANSSYTKGTIVMCNEFNNDDNGANDIKYAQSGASYTLLNMGSSAQAAGNVFTQHVGMTHINSNASFNYYRYTFNAPEYPTQNVGLANVIGTGSDSGCSDGLIDGDEIIGLTSNPENHYTFLLARLDSITKYSLLSATLETRTVNSISLLVNRTLSKLLTQEIEDTTLAILKVWQQRIPDEMNYLVKYTDTSAIAEITRAKNEVSSSSWDSDDKTAYTDLLDILYDLNQAGLDPTDLDSIDIAYIESMAIDSLEHASTWAKSIMEFYFDEPSYFSPLKQKESSNSIENKKYVQKVADKFSIFPNPSNSTVTFKSTENEYQNGEILIYSTLGQLVSTFPLDNGNLTFDLPVGSYFTSFKKIDGSVKFLEYLRIIQ